MSKTCKVTYLDHSGFLLETESRYLLFDYIQGELPSFTYEKPLYVFVSHVHRDHYSRKIFKLENSCRKVTYVLSFDVKEADSAWKKADDVHIVDYNKKYQIGNLQIETLKSTDEGVAFLLLTDGLSIYHAGDLHWWEFSDREESRNQENIRNYKTEIRKIAGRRFDIAFVVLDPRQGEMGGKGMDLFLSEVGARYVFPMHLWGRYDLIVDYKSKNQLKYVTSQIMDIRYPGQTFELVL